ncbi:MAG: DNA polymerase III subunit beta [Trueperaceae bacterium]|nr:MAG: DNA polymerase III subunit beta [Trueperaceae bacterium]
MRVHLATKTLTEALGHVERIIPSRSSNPGLSLLRIAFTEGRLVLSGSNLDLDVRAVVEADVRGEGEVAVPASVLGMVVRALPADDVTFDVGDAELEVASGTFATKLQLVPAENAPVLEFPDAFEGEIEGIDLAKALDHVRYAAAVADYQAVFRGVRLELHDGRTRAVATDGFRLASYHAASSTGLDADLLIPGRSVDELVKLLGPGPARLALRGNQLTVANGAFTVNAKLMEGAFPDYERVIPAQFPVKVTLSADALADAVARVAVMADKSANHRVDIFIKDGVLQITAEGSYGRAQEAIDVLQEGSEAEIALAYNAKYLADAVSPIDGDLQLQLSGTTTPSVATDLGDPAYLAMVVPLRTG